MYFLLFLFYFLLGCWFIGRWSFFRNSGVPVAHLRGYFALKVAAGAAYGFYFHRWEKGADTWQYHQDGLMETALLRHQPLRFITTLLPGNNHKGFSGFFDTRHSWWNDLDANTLPKLLGLCNLATGSNYYGNTVLVNLLLLAGPVLLLRTWRRLSGAAANPLQYLPFLIPSVVFWCSGIHKEGFLLLALGMAVSATSALLGRHQRPRSAVLQLLAALFILTALRNFLLAPLLLCLGGWVLVATTKAKPIPAMAGIVLGLCLAAMLAAWLFPQYNPAQLLVARRAAFDSIAADSKIYLPPLEPYLGSVVRQLPAAFAMGWLRPFPQDVYNYTSALAFADQLIVLGSTLLFVGVYKKTSREQQALATALLLFCLAVILIIGYTVPLLGAVVRYRSILTPLWLIGICGVGRPKSFRTLH